jgi:hypothetical protein
MVSPPKCSTVSRQGDKLRRTSQLANEISEQVSIRHLPEGQVTQRMRGASLLRPTVICTRTCFLRCSVFSDLVKGLVKKVVLLKVVLPSLARLGAGNAQMVATASGAFGSDNRIPNATAKTCFPAGKHRKQSCLGHHS